jgi:hypothetical protein
MIPYHHATTHDINEYSIDDTTVNPTILADQLPDVCSIDHNNIAPH